MATPSLHLVTPRTAQRVGPWSARRTPLWRRVEHASAPPTCRPRSPPCVVAQPPPHPHRWLYPGTVARRRVKKFMDGIANRFPHVPVGTAPLCLAELTHVAASFHITSAASLWSCSKRHLSQWARIITAHDACLRPVEHSQGCRLSDVTDCGGYIRFRVGHREDESKYKHRPRFAVLPVQITHLSAGYVLRILGLRIHPESKRSAGNDPVLFRAGPRTRAAEPWSAAFKRLKSLAAEAGVNVATGRCLRAGGATDLFANGAPEWFVKQQGGWRSNAVERYNRPTTGQRAKVATVYSAKILAAAVAASESFITD